MVDLWNVIAAERGALADDLAALTDEQWKARSLCTDWTVRRVVGHLTATARLTPRRFVSSFARSGFSINRFANNEIDKHLGPGNVATLANFRGVQDLTTSPPGPKQSWLGEVIVHAEDIRRPLGIAHTYPGDAVQEVAEFYKTSNALIGTKTRISGLSLMATDADFRHGTGEEVAGPMLSLVMAMTGRSSTCDDLTGPGVETLRSRGR
ncbi:uncharacterized protein (TIGR03083 family) [Marmoricola sp. OAE513]|uniref:maleylpyruvate isomerase family mycothiol-dependent enzyme n=1 Tax=Marmoricola sp. OAE513 TaxID=2817894 RepID=UPI001AE54D2A